MITIATSRTGTSTWRKTRARALHQAQAAGQTRCPYCNRQLAWGTTRQPNSPEPDHIKPHSLGGTDTLDNLQACCRQCNQSRGNKTGPKPRTIQTVAPLTTSRQW